MRHENQGSSHCQLFRKYELGMILHDTRYDFWSILLPEATINKEKVREIPRRYLQRDCVSIVSLDRPFLEL